MEGSAQIKREERRAYNFLVKIHTAKRDLRGENIPGRKPLNVDRERSPESRVARERGGG